MKKSMVLGIVMVIVLSAGQTHAIRRPDRDKSPVTPRLGQLSATSESNLVPEPATSPSRQKQAQARSNAWQRFTQKSGRWTARWNKSTQTPHLATGRPLVITPGPLARANIEPVCRGFVKLHSELLGADADKLRTAQAVNAGGRWYVAFQQMHDGVPVLGGRVRMSFTKDDRLASLGSDIYPDVNINTTPIVNAETARQIAIADALLDAGDMDRISEPQLYVLPMRSGEGFDYALCWRLDILQSSIQKKWRYLIDARTGDIRDKHDSLWYSGATGTVRGEYKPEFASDANSVATFPYVKVVAEGEEVVIQSWDLETDPGWLTEGEWAFGQPTGKGFDCGDPSSGATGVNVYGYNLNGNYADDMDAQSLTTTPIDCSAYGNVRLKFKRWLGVEESIYDKARVEVSSDGQSWSPVWTHNGGSVCDGRWYSLEYDISAKADHQPMVFIRWVMGPSDVNLVYPGWNIDDIEVVSVQGNANSTYANAEGTYGVQLPWNPATIVSRLSGSYADVHYAGVLDAKFRREPVYPDSIVDWTWTSSLCSAFAETNAYFHINRMHEYFKTLDPSFSGMDYAVPTYVYAGFSNAYWDGYNMVFGRGDGVYWDDFALYSEVIYHEYTHGVTDGIYGSIELPYIWESGAMNEGWSDYFATIMSPSQSVLIGDGGLLIGELDGFRTLDNNYRRETDWVNEVHDDSQMFTGALWQARTTIGAEVMDELVHFSRYAHATTFEDYVMALLLEDDTRYGDGDITNGTPHCQAIYAAFGDHGIGGIQYLAPSIVTSGDKPRGNGRLEPGDKARLSLSLTNGWFDAHNIRATLTTSEPHVTIIKSTSCFPDVAMGDTTSNTSDPFIIRVHPGCPETATLRFAMTITAEGLYSYSRTSLFYCNVAVDQLAYDDSSDEGYIIMINPGDGAAVKMTPDSYPCYPTAVRLFPQWSTSMDVILWSEGPDGAPGEVLGTVSAHPPAINDWFDVDISQLGIAINSGSVFVGWSQRLTPYLNGIDFEPPYHQRSWIQLNSEWSRLDDIVCPGNFLVRLRYSDQPPLRIAPPFEYTWCPDRSISACLSAVNAEGRQLRWTAMPLPSDYSHATMGSSLFTTVGSPRDFHQDDRAFSYTLPFTFPFYGTNRTSVYVSPNGVLDFVQPGPFWTGTPDELMDNVCIAPMWTDLTTFEPNDIYIDESISGQVTIRWGAGTYWFGYPANFAVVLFGDGRIRFDYGPGNTHIYPTVGISAGDGKRYTSVQGYTYASVLTNANSVLFTPLPSRPSLPPGITLNGLSGCLSGTPDSAGTYITTIVAQEGPKGRRTAARDITFNVGYRPSDIDSDCLTSFSDYAILASSWRGTDCGQADNWCHGADIDHSTEVDYADLVIFAGEWLTPF